MERAESSASCSLAPMPVKIFALASTSHTQDGAALGPRAGWSPASASPEEAFFFAALEKFFDSAPCGEEGLEIAREPAHPHKLVTKPRLSAAVHNLFINPPRKKYQAAGGHERKRSRFLHSLCHFCQKRLVKNGKGDFCPPCKWPLLLFRVSRALFLAWHNACDLFGRNGFPSRRTQARSLARPLAA